MVTRGASGRDRVDFATVRSTYSAGGCERVSAAGARAGPRTTRTRRQATGNVVVSQFVTLDGVFEDPGGSEGTERGGWAFRFNRGPKATASSWTR